MRGCRTVTDIVPLIGNDTAGAGTFGRQIRRADIRRDVCPHTLYVTTARCLAGHEGKPDSRKVVTLGLLGKDHAPHGRNQRRDGDFLGGEPGEKCLRIEAALEGEFRTSSDKWQNDIAPAAE